MSHYFVIVVNMVFSAEDHSCFTR